MIQLTLTLKMTTAQVVETSVTVNNNSPIQAYVHPDDQTQPFEMTPGFKPFSRIKANGQGYTLIHSFSPFPFQKNSFKVMLHGTICNTSFQHCCNIVSNGFNVVLILLRCVA